jgi:hypothetical protein
MLRMLSAVRALRSSAEILARAADAHHTAGTRRVSAARIAPTSGRIVTKIQSVGPRPDSPVRIRYAQPGSPISARYVRFAEIHALARRLRSPSSKAVTNSIHCRGSRNRNRSKSGGARCADTAASTRSWSSLTVLFGIDRRLFEEFERKHHLKGIKFKLTVK